MTTSDTFQIASTGGTTTSLFRAPPILTVPSLPSAIPSGITPGYSTVIGSGGTTGSGWPFSDYNIMNDPEGDLAALPALYYQGAGGQGGDEAAFQPGFNDSAMAGYENVGAGMTGNDTVQVALNDPNYIEGATQLNNSNLAGADAIAIQVLAQDSTGIDWNQISQTQNGDLLKGATELLKSAGTVCSATAAGAANCMVAGLQSLSAGGNAEVTTGITAFRGAQCVLGSAVALGECLSRVGNGPMDADENYFLGTMYRSILVGAQAFQFTGGGGGVDGGDALGSGKLSAIGGSAITFDATLGGKLNYLTDSYNATTGTVNHLHA